MVFLCNNFWLKSQFSPYSTATYRPPPPGCIILLQFCPRLTKGGGRLVHESVGDAIQTLNKKLKVSNIILKGDTAAWKMLLIICSYLIYYRANWQRDWWREGRSVCKHHIKTGDHRDARPLPLHHQWTVRHKQLYIRTLPGLWAPGLYKGSQKVLQNISRIKCEGRGDIFCKKKKCSMRKIEYFSGKSQWNSHPRKHTLGNLTCDSGKIL